MIFSEIAYFSCTFRKLFVTLQTFYHTNTTMLIGREKQQQELLDLLQSDESQFCAIYGRRRVGKTFLVKQTFKGQFAFVHTGLSNSNKKDQLWEFRESLRNAGMKRCRLPKTWFEAFHLLEQHLSTLTQEKKIVLRRLITNKDFNFPVVIIGCS